jgi:hypothetical protein
MLGKHFTNELHPQPLIFIFIERNNNMYKLMGKVC